MSRRDRGSGRALWTGINPSRRAWLRQIMLAEAVSAAARGERVIIVHASREAAIRTFEEVCGLIGDETVASKVVVTTEENSTILRIDE